jgi:cytochrome c peroxidase
MNQKCTGVLTHVFIITLILCFISITGLNAQLSDYFKPVPQKAPAPKDNPITPEKIELGKKLYFEPRLSGSGLISCNTCHNLSISGDDNRLGQRTAECADGL